MCSGYPRAQGSVIASSITKKLTQYTSCRSGSFQKTKELKPSYEEKSFKDDEKRGKLRLIASRSGRNGSLTIHRDVDLYATLLSSGQMVTHELSAGRVAWIQIA